MGEFCSGLMKDLADAAHIQYDPRKPDDEFVYKRLFTNEDARRMDRMKTAIMRLILLRARNYMVNKRQDEEKKVSARKAEVTLDLCFTDADIHHRGQPIQDENVATRDELAALAALLEDANKFAEFTKMHTMSTGLTIFENRDLDLTNGKADLDILVEMINLKRPVEKIVVSPRHFLNCR